MTSMTYRRGNDLDLDQLIELYQASTLGERRPVGQRDTMARMLKEANLVVSAWSGSHLLGIARTLTDFVYCAYLSDLAVHRDWQRRGIGRELIRHTQSALGADCKIILLAAPKARDYYPHLGFTPHDSAWLLGARERLREPYE